MSNNSNGHTLCRRRSEAGRGAAGIQVEIDAAGTRRELPVNFDHTSPTWVSQALTDFNGHLRDKAHGVAELRMPLSGNPVVQAGASVLAMERAPNPHGDESRLEPSAAAREDNTKSMRFLVDPMLQTEPDDVRRQKFAFKASVRIIDGVWFLRDEDHPELPGKPIWSDHPGSGNITYSDTITPRVRDVIIHQDTNVGQENLRTALPWATTPKHFSYYGFTSTSGTYTWTRTAASTERAVISYGLLQNAGSSVWNPGAVRDAHDDAERHREGKHAAAVLRRRAQRHQKRLARGAQRGDRRSRPRGQHVGRDKALARLAHQLRHRRLQCGAAKLCRRRTRFVFPRLRRQGRLQRRRLHFVDVAGGL